MLVTTMTNAWLAQRSKHQIITEQFHRQTSALTMAFCVAMINNKLQKLPNLQNILLSKKKNSSEISDFMKVIHLQLHLHLHAFCSLHHWFRCNVLFLLTLIFAIRMATINIFIVTTHVTICMCWWDEQILWASSLSSLYSIFFFHNRLKF